MRFVALGLLVSLLACATSSESEPERAAACASQQYLLRNGYLDQRATDLSALDLELWDRVAFESDGHMDWERLISSRHGKFSNRLYGVMRGEGLFFVAYRNEAGTFNCVNVREGAARLVEANCRPRAPIVRMSQRSLECY